MKCFHRTLKMEMFNHDTESSDIHNDDFEHLIQSVNKYLGSPQPPDIAAQYAVHDPTVEDMQNENSSEEEDKDVRVIDPKVILRKIDEIREYLQNTNCTDGGP
jgi:hypothetical protein